VTGMLASTLATLLLTGALVAPSRGQGEFRIVVRLGSGDGSDAIDAKDVERLMAVYERRLDGTRRSIRLRKVRFSRIGNRSPSSTPRILRRGSAATIS